MLYGTHLKFSFTEQDVNELLEAVEAYSEEEKIRVKEIIRYQSRKYTYLFSK